MIEEQLLWNTFVNNIQTRKFAQRTLFSKPSLLKSCTICVIPQTSLYYVLGKIHWDARQYTCTYTGSSYNMITHTCCACLQMCCGICQGRQEIIAFSGIYVYTVCCHSVFRNKITEWVNYCYMHCHMIVMCRVAIVFLIIYLYIFFLEGGLFTFVTQNIAS